MSSNLLTALRAARSEMPDLRTDSANPHFGNRYLSLAGMLSQVEPILGKHDLVWTTLPAADERGPCLKYRLAHTATGEVLEDRLPLMLSKQDMQGLGSAISYARRYALQSVLNLAADDDDGNAASRDPIRQTNGLTPSRPQVVQATPGPGEDEIAVVRVLDANVVREGSKNGREWALRELMLEQPWDGTVKTFDAIGPGLVKVKVDRREEHPKFGVSYTVKFLEVVRSDVTPPPEVVDAEFADATADAKATGEIPF